MISVGAPGKNSVHGRLVLISNNYTKVSNEHGTFLFFCYALNSSMYKNKLTLLKITLLKEIICFKDLPTFLALKLNDSPLCSKVK